jgi:hypothetical protein
MDMSILRLVHGQILPTVTAPETAGQLEQLLQLVRCTYDLQSEPAAMADELLQRLQDFGGVQEPVLKIIRDIQSGQRLAVPDWLLLCYLATFRWALQDRWDDCYTIIFDAYPPLGQQANRVAAFLEDVPFAGAVAVLEREWEDRGKRPGIEPRFEMVALTYVRVCGQMGIFGGGRLYEMVSGCLALNKEFLIVVLAAACFKVPAISSQVSLGSWTDAQYACMRVLDNFAHLGETAWG